MWHVTCDFWHVTCDMWLLTCDMKCFGWFDILEQISSKPCTTASTHCHCHWFIFFQLSQDFFFYQFSWKLTKISHTIWPLSLMRNGLKLIWELIYNANESSPPTAWLLSFFLHRCLSKEMGGIYTKYVRLPNTVSNGLKSIKKILSIGHTDLFGQISQKAAIRTWK